MVGYLVFSLTGWLVPGFDRRLNSWAVGRLLVCLVGDWLGGWKVGQLVGWLGGWLVGWLASYFAHILMQKICND